MRAAITYTSKYEVRDGGRPYIATTVHRYDVGDEESFVRRLSDILEPMDREVRTKDDLKGTMWEQEVHDDERFGKVRWYLNLRKRIFDDIVERFGDERRNHSAGCSVIRFVLPQDADYLVLEHMDDEDRFVDAVVEVEVAWMD